MNYEQQKSLPGHISRGMQPFADLMNPDLHMHVGLSHIIPKHRMPLIFSQVSGQIGTQPRLSTSLGPHVRPKNIILHIYAIKIK